MNAILIAAAILFLPLILSLLSVLIYWMRWVALVAPERRPYPLNLPHNDFVWPFGWIPRAWTAFLCDRMPRQIAGNNPKDHHTDIPAPGTWSLTVPFHFAITTKSRWLFHIGLRRDYQPVGYYNLDVTVKRLK